MTEIDLSEFKKKKAFSCVVKRHIETLTKEDQEKVLAAFLENDIPTVAIAQWMQEKLKKPVSDSSVRKHRAKGCGCNE